MSVALVRLLPVGSIAVKPCTVGPESTLGGIEVERALGAVDLDADEVVAARDVVERDDDRVAVCCRRSAVERVRGRIGRSRPVEQQDDALGAPRRRA